MPAIIPAIGFPFFFNRKFSILQISQQMLHQAITELRFGTAQIDRNGPAAHTEKIISILSSGRIQ